MSPTLRIFVFALVFALVSNAAHAQVSSYKAYTLFVYNFTKYIQWPDGSIRDEFVIGVYGNSPIKEEFEKMGALKKAGEKSIRVIEITDLKLVNELHILFVPDEKSAQISDIMTTLRGKPVLVVGERQGLTDKGAGISFFSEQNNVRFELNSASIALQKLKVANALIGLSSKKGS